MNARSRAAPVTGQASTSYPQAANERSLRSVEEAAQSCRACDLWKSGTQTVFGAGPRSASVMFIGEQPGDQEDRAGERSSDRRATFSTKPWSPRASIETSCT